MSFLKSLFTKFNSHKSVYVLKGCPWMTSLSWGERGQAFWYNSTKVSVIKRVTMGGGQKTVQNCVTSYMSDSLLIIYIKHVFILSTLRLVILKYSTKKIFKIFPRKCKSFFLTHIFSKKKNIQIAILENVKRRWIKKYDTLLISKTDEAA